MVALPKSQGKRFFGKCLLTTGQEVVLKTTASSEVEASRNLHRDYATVDMVLDILTTEDLHKLHRSRKPSLLGIPHYR